jgi:hypothetical protein
VDEGIPVAVAAAAEPVLHDLAVVGLRPRVAADRPGDAGEQRAMTWWPDGTGYGVWVRGDEGFEACVARLADQLQDAAVEALPGLGRPAVWSECPDHPGRHPLQALILDGLAVWACPREGRVVARVGELSSASG